MATTLLVRGSNPVWSFVDLTAHQFDDTFYMWVLQNDIPYFPATVWHDPDGNLPWTQPIQFFANGTLPIDIYWDPSVTYRLEFRQHLDPLTSPTQADPLIYLVENYQPGGSGSTPIDTASVITDNQMTNPQFAEISFSSPYSISGTNLTVQVAPGWFLTLAGTGTAAFERVPLNSTLSTATNAPYALRLTLAGWTPGGVKLKQRFQQAGMLWSSTPGHTRYVASSVTARVEGDPALIVGRLVDSMSTVLTEVLTSTQINSTFNEYKGFGLMPVTTNTNTPPAAYIEYELLLPATADIYLTSFQLTQSEIATTFEYEQDSIDRQIDHTWHYYRDAMVMKPKASILTGWNFPLNPMQNNPLVLTTATSQTQYVGDQTIIHQLAGSTVKTGIPGVNRAFQVQAVNGAVNNRFALIQYIAPKTILPYWSYILSSMARMRIFTAHGTAIGVKMRLIWRVDLPATLSNTEPIASWAGTDPVFSAGWTEIAPSNDPEYILPNSYDDTEAGNAFPAFSYDSFEMPNWSGSNPDTHTLGVVIYTTANMNDALGTEDSVEFQRISLVPNLFAVDSPPQTADQVLRECQYYYQKSFIQGVLPAQGLGVGNGEYFNVQNVGGASAAGVFSGINFTVPMNTQPAITLYDPVNADAQIYNFATSTTWTGCIASNVSPNGFWVAGTTPGGSAIGNLLALQWTADARLGT